MTKTELTDLLIAGNCLKYGNFNLKNGGTSNYYINLRESGYSAKLTRLLVKELVAKIQSEIVRDESIDKFAVVGVPYGVCELTGIVAHELGCAYAKLSKEKKAHGVEIDLDPLRDHRFIVIEDVMSSGSSIIETIQKLDGYKVTDVIVVADREAGGERNLKAQFPNVRVHSILRSSDMLPRT